MKNKKLFLIISSVVVLLPILFGLIFWNSLPDSLNTHWGVDGKPDGSSGKAWAVFVLPTVLLLIHWGFVWLNAKLSEKEEYNPKIKNIINWIIPVVSLVANGTVYAWSYGIEFGVAKLPVLLMGVLFLLIGNYLPKCKQSFTMGIKLKWTLANEENWNATHRMAGKLWVVGGILLILCMLLPEKLCMGFTVAIIMLMVLIPTVYSYVYYKKQVKEGKADKKPVVKMSKFYKKMGIKVLTVVGLLIVVAVVLVCFTGFETKFGKTSFEVEAFGCEDLTVEYSAVESVELRDKTDFGIRTYGYGGLSLFMGRFKNEDFGNYTLYAYKGSEKCVVVKADGKYLVLSYDNTKDTVELYNTLCEKVNVDGLNANEVN